MYCGKCGNQIPDHSAFCPICGVKQNTSGRSSGGIRKEASGFALKGTKLFLTAEAIIGSVLIVLALIFFSSGWLGFDNDTETILKAEIVNLTNEDYNDVATEIGMNLSVVKRTFTTLKDGRLSPMEVKTITGGINKIMKGLLAAAAEDPLGYFFLDATAGDQIKQVVNGLGTASFFCGVLTYGTYLAAIGAVAGLLLKKRWSCIPFFMFVTGTFIFFLVIIGKIKDAMSIPMISSYFSDFPLNNIRLKMPAFLCMLFAALSAALPYLDISKRISFSGLPVNFSDSRETAEPVQDIIQVFPNTEPAIPDERPVPVVPAEEPVAKEYERYKSRERKMVIPDSLLSSDNPRPYIPSKDDTDRNVKPADSKDHDSSFEEAGDL